MRPFSIVATLFIIFSAAGCKKSHSHPAATPQPGQLFEISGQLFVKDFYGSGTDSFPGMNKWIYIRADSSSNKDSANYFASIVTDHDGNFSFYVTDPTLRYDLFGAFYDTSSPSFIPFYSVAIVTDSPYMPGYIYSIKAAADTTDRNGLKLLTTDILGEAIPDVNVFLYSSSVVSIGDTSSFTGKGSFAKISTDSLGKAFIGNLPVGESYINAQFILGDGSKLTLYGAQTLLGATGIVTDTLVLKSY
jgi:hypothetical protein